MLPAYYVGIDRMPFLWWHDRYETGEIMMMPYPSMAEVEKADRVQLGKWMRFLPSPGISHYDTSNDPSINERVRSFALSVECETLHLIETRFRSLGGWSPEISKEVGLECP